MRGNSCGSCLRLRDFLKMRVRPNSVLSCPLLLSVIADDMTATLNTLVILIVHVAKRIESRYIQGHLQYFG